MTKIINLFTLLALICSFFMLLHLIQERDAYTSKYKDFESYCEEDTYLVIRNDINEVYLKCSKKND